MSVFLLPTTSLKFNKFYYIRHINFYLNQFYKNSDISSISPVTYTRRVNVKDSTDMTSKIYCNVTDTIIPTKFGHIYNILDMQIISTKYRYIHKMRIMSKKHGDPQNVDNIRTNRTNRTKRANRTN